MLRDHKKDITQWAIAAHIVLYVAVLELVLRKWDIITVGFTGGGSHLSYLLLSVFVIRAFWYILFAVLICFVAATRGGNATREAEYRINWNTPPGVIIRGDHI